MTLMCVEFLSEKGVANDRDEVPVCGNLPVEAVMSHRLGGGFMDYVSRHYWGKVIPAAHGVQSSRGLDYVHAADKEVRSVRP